MYPSNSNPNSLWGEVPPSEGPGESCIIISHLGALFDKTCSLSMFALCVNDPDAKSMVIHSRGATGNDSTNAGQQQIEPTNASSSPIEKRQKKRSFSLKSLFRMK